MQEITQSEFARQAGAMDSAPAFRDEYVLQWLTRALSAASSDRVLDLACGPGIVAEALAPLVQQMVGLDATPEMIRFARARFEKSGLANGWFAGGAAEALPFGNAVFDQVVTRLAIHHLQDVKSALAEVRRVLCPRGRLIVADVISSEDAEESALHNALEQLRDPAHVRMLPRSELLALVRSAGFAVVSQEARQQTRGFAEWAQIVSNPARTGPLKNVMRALARAGLGAGIGLREDSGELQFTHTWLLLKAQLV